MIDFSLRALRHPRDYLGVFKLSKLTFKESKHELSNIHSFIFEKPKGLSWKSGQHSVFWFFDREIEGQKWRAFSIASSKHEDEIRIATTIPDEPSDFKKKLLGLQPGEHVYMQGPFGEFHTKRKRKIVGVAGGIGITPFRSILHDVGHGIDAHTEVTLIYSATGGNYVFRDSLEKWREQSARIEIIYTQTADEVNKALTEQIIAKKNETYYFFSGSPGMVTALKKLSKEHGAKKLVNDSFKGY